MRYLFFDSILCKAISRGKSKLFSLKLEQSLKFEILEIGEYFITEKLTSGFNPILKAAQLQNLNSKLKKVRWNGCEI